MNKKGILVTGGAGFIGSHLVDRLLSEGSWRVTVVDSFDDAYSPAVKRRNIASHLQNEDYQLFELDICHRESLSKALGSIQIETIVHLAARAGVRLSLHNPHLYSATNIDGTLNLLELARIKGVRRFIFGSSSSVYGINSKVPFSEDDPTGRPIS
ncbi:MAG: GDP-mannose 4,6-dehydratase, partial [Pyrinomonadaceae bacterium]